MKHKQVSVNDCGLFTLSYVRALCLNLEPSLVHFCQQAIRYDNNEFIDPDLKKFKTNIISNQTLSWNNVMAPYTIQLSLLRSN